VLNPKPEPVFFSGSPYYKGMNKIYCVKLCIYMAKLPSAVTAPQCNNAR
jgi:hypothetical protein